MSVLGMMRNTCNIRTKVETQSTATGGLVTTWTSNATATICSIQQSGGFENIQQGREMFQRTYNVFFPASTNIHNTDRLINIVGVSGVGSSIVLEVTSAPVDHSGRGAYVMVTATEITE